MQLIPPPSSDVLGLFDRCEGKPSEEAVRAEARAKRKELDRIEAYYDLAANKQARIVYTGGMFLGLLWLLLAVPLLALVLYPFDAFEGANSAEARTLLACYGAGGLGALVSVMSRMASSKGKFSLDYEVGAEGDPPARCRGPCWARLSASPRSSLSRAAFSQLSSTPSRSTC